jgi:hypothetical protein
MFNERGWVATMSNAIIGDKEWNGGNENKSFILIF